MQKTFTIAGETIIYREAGPEGGSRDIFVLLHGYGGQPSHWNQVAEELSRHARVVIPSLSPLYLSRSRRFTFTETVAVMSAFVEHVAEGKNSRIHLCGASYGGTLAWALATELKERVKGLTLLSPMPPNPMAKIRNGLLRTFVRLASFPIALRVFLLTPMARKALPRIEDMFIGFEHRKRRTLRLQVINSRKVSLVIHILNRFKWIIDREDWHEWESRMSKVPQPVCVLWGQWDRLFQKEVPEQLRDSVANSELHYVENAGHLAMKENPAAVVEILMRFYKRLADAA